MNWMNGMGITMYKQIIIARRDLNMSHGVFVSLFMKIINSISD